MFGKLYVSDSKGRAGVESEDGDMPEVDVESVGNEFAHHTIGLGARVIHTKSE